MLANTEKTEWTTQPELPWNLCEWVDKEVLAEWITEDIEAFDWDDPQLARYCGRNPGFRPKTMLQLLTCAYATGRFEADDILHGCLCDSVLRALSEEEPPTREDIARFTNDYRAQLRWMLTQVLTRAVVHYLEPDDLKLPLGLQRWVEDDAFWRVQCARQVHQKESGE